MKNGIIFIGNYGSGKTEVAVNYARHLRTESHSPISLIDLDVVNPYFRSREATGVLKNEGIEVISPGGEWHHSELPIILPQIRPLLLEPTGPVLLDVGGDDVGASVLASLKDAITTDRFDLWVVLNGRRPFTGNVADATRMVRELEAASSLKATGIVSNTHLLQETTLEIILEGLELSRRTALELSIPLTLLAFGEEHAEEVRKAVSAVPLLPMRLTMLRPWEKK